MFTGRTVLDSEGDGGTGSEGVTVKVVSWWGRSFRTLPHTNNAKNFLRNDGVCKQYTNGFTTELFTNKTDPMTYDFATKSADIPPTMTNARLTVIGKFMSM